MAVKTAHLQPYGFRHMRCSGVEFGLALSFKALSLPGFRRSAAGRKPREISRMTAAETET